MDRLSELQTFVAIVESGSLVAASRRLRRSPPAITRALAAIEERIGTKLIERSTRHFAVTESGQKFFEQAREILASYEAAVAGVSEEPLNGALRITAPVQFGRRHVAPVVAEFIDNFPSIQVELILQDRNIDLFEDRIDVALRIGELPDSALVQHRVGEVRRIIVAAPDYLNRHGCPRSKKGLSKHELILGWQSNTLLKSNRNPAKSRLLVDDVETQISFAKSGHGIAQVLSYQVYDELKSGALVRLLEDIELPPLPVQILLKPTRFASAKVRVFKDALYAALKNNDALSKTELTSI